MTLQELRYLVALADSGHFARAAETCCVSQSTLSAQIKKLEDFLGVTLFDRSLRRVATTPIAREIVSRARLMVHEADALRALAQQDGDPMARSVRLGVIPTIGPYLLPRVIGPLRKQYPLLKLLLREDLTGPLMEQVKSGELEAALLALPAPLEGMRCEALFREPFVAALPRGHPLAAQKNLDAEDLFGKDLLLLDEGHCLREHALAACGRPRSLLAEEMRATSLETLRQMVRMGVGHTLMPALAVPKVSDNAADLDVVYRPLKRPQPYRTLGLVWRKRAASEASLLILSAALRDHMPEELQAVSARSVEV